MAVRRRLLGMVMAIATVVPAAMVGLAAPPASATYPTPGILSYGDATYGGEPSTLLAAPVVGMAANPVGKGYWVVTADGGVFSYGGVGYYGSAGGINLNGPIIGMAATPDGKGYWLVATDGGIFSFGDAGFYGSTGAIRLNQPVVGMASTPDGKGYWLVAADGGIFAFGDARFYGSTGAIRLNQPIVGMAAAPQDGGYWLVAADGGIFAFGDAGFYGTTASHPIPGWVTGMAATHDGKGYWVANANGDVYPFGDAVNYGNDLAAPRTPPIVSITATPDAKGYWLLEPDAFATAFSHPLGGTRIGGFASSQIGPDPDPGYFCNPYGPCEEWCALFATWVWETAGVPIPRYAFVGNIYYWAAQHTAVLPPSARPSPGDLVLYGTGPQTVATAVHVGVVEQVWPDGAIDTVEGDSGPGPTGDFNVTINGPYLPSDSKVYNGMPIFGYAVP